MRFMRFAVTAVFAAALASACAAQGVGRRMPGPARAGSGLRISALTRGPTVRELVSAKEPLGYADCVVCPATQELLAVDNHGRKTIDVFDLNGRYKRSIPTVGFPDLEGIVLIEGTTFALIDEKDRDITILSIGPTTATVDKAAGKRYAITLSDTENTGLEGITYDPVNRWFYVVVETPLSVYKVVLEGEAAVLSEPFDARKALGAKCKDFLDGVYDATSGHLFFLSDTSACIVETDLTGAVLSEHKIPGELPEGFCFSPDRRTLYLIDQRGALYRFNVMWGR